MLLPTQIPQPGRRQLPPHAGKYNVEKLEDVVLDKCTDDDQFGRVRSEPLIKPSALSIRAQCPSMAAYKMCVNGCSL